MHADRSIRVVRLGWLPCLVWYAFDLTRPKVPIWLLLLMHEKQDRARFGPTTYDS